MDSLTSDFRAALAHAQPPCLSLYQPTHRHHPQNQQDPIRFGNLVKELEQSIQQKYSSDEVAQRLAAQKLSAAAKPKDIERRSEPDDWRRCRSKSGAV